MVAAHLAAPAAPNDIADVLVLSAAGSAAATAPTQHVEQEQPGSADAASSAVQASSALEPALDPSLDASSTAVLVSTAAGAASPCTQAPTVPEASSGTAVLASPGDVAACSSGQAQLHSIADASGQAGLPRVADAADASFSGVLTSAEVQTAPPNQHADSAVILPATISVAVPTGTATAAAVATAATTPGCTPIPAEQTSLPNVSILKCL